MADVTGLDALAPEKLLLEGEDAEQHPDRLPQCPDAPFSPRPGLRRYQVNHWDSRLCELARHPKMEIRGVRQDGQVGLLRPGLGYQFAVFAVDSRDVGNHFQQA